MTKPDATPLPIHAHLLGPARIEVGERLLGEDAWPRRAARSLLLLLLLTPGHRLARDQALDMLWPDAAQDSALNSFYLALAALRRTLEPELKGGRDSAYVEARGGTIGLREIPGTSIDTDDFRAAVARADAAQGHERSALLREAVALYGGDLLADEPYADWPVAARERLRSHWRHAILELAALEREAGRPLAALPGVEALLAADPTDEAAHRAAMEALAAAGRRDEALAWFQRCRTTLREELDAEPSEETLALAAAIEAAHTIQPVLVAPARPALRVGNVPVAPSPLIGRSEELASLAGLLGDEEVRLVTLVGPGGIGKTRLALEAARQLEAAGAVVAFVPLAAVRDPELVIPVVARSLGVEESGAASVADDLRDALYQRELLLVIDNFEQVIDAAVHLAVLLESERGLRMMVTSREPLHLRAEHVYRVEPLTVETAAVQLFLDRARAVDPGFRSTDVNSAAVAAICARLDGIPLAIELAAARVRHLEPELLIERLHQRLPILTEGARDLPERQQAMSDAIKWSYDLLDRDEQGLFRSFAVFVGGCSIEAAGAVAGASRVLIDSLADKSLLRVDPESQRIGMLETIREFAGSVRSPEEQEALSTAHARYYLDLAERAATEMTGPGQATWLAMLETDHDNLRAALETLTADPDPAGGLRLVRALSRFWRMHGHYSEGRAQLERALARPGPRDATRARALITAADLAEVQRDYAAAEAAYTDAAAILEEAGDASGVAEAAIGLAGIALGRTDLATADEHAERAVAMTRAAGDLRGTASALNYLASVRFRRGAFDAAAPLWEECLGILEQIGDERARSIALTNLAALELQRGSTGRAADRHREAIEIARRLADPYALAHALVGLGGVLVLEKRYDEARPILDEALERATAIGDPQREAGVLYALGMADVEEGRLDEAGRHLADSLERSHGAGDLLTVASVLDGAAQVALARGEPARAAALVANADALFTSLGAAREPAYAPIRDRAYEAAVEILSSEELRSAEERAEAMPLEEAVAEALAYLRSAGQEPLTDS